MDIDDVKLLIDKYIVDYVYNAARIEGLNTKYLDTKLFVEDGIIPNNISEDKILILRNLKDAYKALKDPDFLNMHIDIISLCRVNSIINGRGLVKEAGHIRKDPVYILNSKYIPDLPDQYQINNDIIDMTQLNENPLDIAIRIYLYLMRVQPFIDGNKRTANVFANLYLLRHMPMLISVHGDKRKKFLSLLNKFYETNDYDALSKYIKENGLYSIKK